MKFFRRPPGGWGGGHTIFDHKKNEEIREDLEVEPVDEKLKRYKSNWLRHVTRLNNRMPKIMLNSTGWKTTTWETFEGTIRRERNTSIKA